MRAIPPPPPPPLSPSVRQRERERAGDSLPGRRHIESSEALFCVGAQRGGGGSPCAIVVAGTHRATHTSTASCSARPRERAHIYLQSSLCAVDATAANVNKLLRSALSLCFCLTRMALYR